jgi:hypothetical protein
MEDFLPFKVAGCDWIAAVPRFSSAFSDGGAWARMERITIRK